MFSLALPLSLHPQRTLNSNNVYTEDGTLYRSGFGESTVSLDSTLRSAKSRSSYLAYVLRYNTLTDCMAASATQLHACVLFSLFELLFVVLHHWLADTNTPLASHTTDPIARLALALPLRLFLVFFHMCMLLQIGTAL